MMKERTLRVLEFTRIREMLAEGALTEAGAEKCRTLEPADDLAAAQALQAETEEAAVILQFTGGHPMTAFPDIRPALTICEKGGSLSAGMLLNVAELLRASRAARDALVTDRENTPILRGKAEGLFVARNIEKDITDAIIGWPPAYCRITVASSVSACRACTAVSSSAGSSCRHFSAPAGVRAPSARSSRILVNSSTRNVRSFIIFIIPYPYVCNMNTM